MYVLPIEKHEKMRSFISAMMKSDSHKECLKRSSYSKMYLWNPESK